MPSNTKEFVASAAKWPSQQELSTEQKNGFKFQVGNNKSRTTCYYCGEKGQYMSDCKVNKKAEMTKVSERSEAKEFGNFAADEEYEPADDQNIKEIGF